MASSVLPEDNAFSDDLLEDEFEEDRESEPPSKRPRPDDADKQAGTTSTVHDHTENTTYVIHGDAAYLVPFIGWVDEAKDASQETLAGRRRDYGDCVVVESDDVLDKMDDPESWPAADKIPPTAIVVVKAKHSEDDTLPDDKKKGLFGWYARVITKKEVGIDCTNSHVLRHIPKPVCKALTEFMMLHRQLSRSSLTQWLQPHNGNEKPFPCALNGWERHWGGWAFRQKPEEKPLVQIEDLQCPITHELIFDPVVADDGFVYERVAIEKWLSSNETSPMTAERILKKLLPCAQFKNIVEKLVASNALDAEKAEMWEKKRALKDKMLTLTLTSKKGDAAAALWLAEQYMEGNEVTPIDKPKAILMLKTAAESKSSAAAGRLAVVYYLGQHEVAKNNALALYWATIGAERGNYVSNFVLAQFFYDGTYGMAVDIHKWFMLMNRSKMRSAATSIASTSQLYHFAKACVDGRFGEPDVARAKSFMKTITSRKGTDPHTDMAKQWLQANP